MSEIKAETLSDEMIRHLESLIIYNGLEFDFFVEYGEFEDEIWFPDPRLGYDPTGTHFPVAASADVSAERLELGYSYGFFPWSDYRGKYTEWFCPLERFVLFPSKVHVSHSMRTLLNKKRYRVTFNESFEEVVHHCATVDGRNAQNGAWLGPELIEEMTKLWKKGVIKSVEVRDTQDNDRLVGGLYGYWINGCFMGDSMFSLVPSGSKIALIGLCRKMEKIGGKLIDMQIRTKHLASMGGESLPYIDFLRYLNPEALATIDPNVHPHLRITLKSEDIKAFEAAEGCDDDNIGGDVEDDLNAEQDTVTLQPEVEIINPEAPVLKIIKQI